LFAREMPSEAIFDGETTRPDRPIGQIRTGKPEFSDARM
jgi:hypothetical protein